MIYLKLRSDSKRDGIKREHVIFNQACLRSRQRRANYVYVSASAGQIWSWGGGGGEGRFEKNVRSSGKILATPLISPSAICVSAVNICIWSFLAWFSMMRIIYKHDDLDYSQESNCPFVVKYTWPCWYRFLTAKNLFRLTGWSFITTKFFFFSVLRGTNIYKFWNPRCNEQCNLPYMVYVGMCRCEGYGFQAVYSRIGYINQNIWV